LTAGLAAAFPVLAVAVLAVALTAGLSGAFGPFFALGSGMEEKLKKVNECRGVLYLTPLSKLYAPIFHAR